MDIIKKTKNKCPLIHCITNYVTINDVAKVILAYSGLPVVVREILDGEEI